MKLSIHPLNFGFMRRFKLVDFQSISGNIGVAATHVGHRTFEVVAVEESWENV